MLSCFESHTEQVTKKKFCSNCNIREVLELIEVSTQNYKI